MANPNGLPSFEREVYTEAAGNVRTRETLYQNGSMIGQLIEEEHLFAQRFPGRNVRSSLLIGAILVTLLGIGVVLWYLLSQSSNKPMQQIILPRNEAPRTP